MDKSWMGIRNRYSAEYQEGIKLFIEFAEKNSQPGVDMFCPCIDCLNFVQQPTKMIRFHLQKYGISPTYKIWRQHGETIIPEQDFGTTNIMQNDDIDSHDENNENTGDDDDQDNITDMVEDMYMGGLETDDLGESTNKNEGENVNIFFNLLKDVQSELYPGCKSFSILSFVIKMFHMKVMFKWSDVSFNELLKVLKQLLPGCDKKVPWSLYEAKKFLRNLGLGYECIHACKYDCALFWKENANLDKCPVCNEPRYAINEEKGTKIPHKVLRYFPLASRLKRLFMSRKIAADMRWHREKRVDDGILRHPADGKEWKEFDQTHFDFANESRNVRLGLSSDGFNPHGERSSTKSVWPVIVTPYNLPPWKCMKETYCIMTLLIPGPSQPGRDIDVYLRPLIDELNMLFKDGIPTYDAVTKNVFRMRAVVIGTINDFPAYGNLSGWSTKGYLACPICNKDKSSQGLTSKIGYTGARRFLPNSHSWRKSKIYDGKPDHRSRPAVLTGEQILEQLDSETFHPFGKNPEILKKQRKENDRITNWKKKSIFWELPYWKTLKIRHNLDVMHIEKNICDNVLGTLLSSDKSKDTEKARIDLEKLGIRKHLHLKKREKGSRFIKPKAPYTLSTHDRKSFCEFLNSVKYLDGYASNLTRCANVKDGKVLNLKSHDCHVLLQRLLPIGMRGYLDDDICSALFELGDFFRQLCSKTLRVSDLEKMQENIVLVLCKLEKIFPPAFFDVMVHLAIHLPREALLGGPVQYRWMYPIERLLGVFKAFVANRTHPEGSMAEKYIDKECTTFCSMYLSGVSTAFNKEERNEDRVHSNEKLTAFAEKIRPFGEILRGLDVSKDEQDAAHWYILNNSVEVEQYVMLHKNLLQSQNVNDIVKKQQNEFPQWFQTHMNQIRSENSPEATDELWSLANGPKPIVNIYTACIYNGVRYFVRDRDNRRKSQNSGVFVMANHKGKMHEFYGHLSKVWELNYNFGHKVCLFQCEWYNTGTNKTYKSEKHVKTIDVTSRWYKSDSFVFPSQVRQVFYVDDTKLGDNWKVVEHLQRRGIWDIPELSDGDLIIDDESPLNVALQQQETTMTDVILDEDPILRVPNDKRRNSTEDEIIIIPDEEVERARKRARANDINDDEVIHYFDGEEI